MIMDVSMLWLIAAANVLLVAPLIFFLIQAAGRARTEKIRAEVERIRFQENEQRLRSLLDRRQALQHAVAKVLAGASTVEQAVPDLLQAIVVNLDWHAGLFWRVQDDRQTIICAHGWSVDTTVMQDFLRRSGQEAHTSGSDLPGHCWARGEPLWVEDVARDLMFARGSVEATGTLHAACVFPIWLRTNVYGVRELFSSEPQAEDRDVLRALGTVGRQIGLFVERTEVEAALHENEARTSLIIDTALDAVMTMDGTGRIIEWNAQAEQMFGWLAHEVTGRDVADTIFPPSTASAIASMFSGFLNPGMNPSQTGWSK